MDVGDFATVSGRWDLLAPKPPGDWRNALEAFLGDLAQALERAGCPMIGHIKGMLDDGSSPSLFFSLTSFEGPAHFRGGLPTGGDARALSLNVIAAGIDREETRVVVEEKLRGHFTVR